MIELKTAADVTGLIDHAILQPNNPDAKILAELQQLRDVPLASICIKPYAVKLAVKTLPETAIGTVIGFPHGAVASTVKAAEAELAFADGARDVDMVVNVGKVIDGDWGYVQDDIAGVLDVARKHSGVIKVIFETAYLNDDHKLKLCEICGELKVDFVKTSTGFGYTKNADGTQSAKGATEADIKLMRAKSPEGVGVKASGGVRTLDDVIKMVAAGANRIGSGSTFDIQRQAQERFGEQVGAAKEKLNEGY